MELVEAEVARLRRRRLTNRLTYRPRHRPLNHLTYRLRLRRQYLAILRWGQKGFLPTLAVKTPLKPF